MPVQEITHEKIIAAGQIRFFAPLLAAKVVSRYFTNPKSSECSIVLTTGSIAEHPMPGWSAVAAYGAGLVCMTRNLALDLKPVRVNCVAPGLMDTNLWEKGGMTRDTVDSFFEEMAQKLPTGRIAGPEDIAESYVYLLKDRNITGKCIGTDSGVMWVRSSG
jgi:NAD(P)-dependent dehydrogenase (short-subunit alcohol dehydrogenase family)